MAGAVFAPGEGSQGGGREFSPGTCTVAGWARGISSATGSLTGWGWGACRDSMKRLSALLEDLHERGFAEEPRWWSWSASSGGPPKIETNNNIAGPEPLAVLLLRSAGRRWASAGESMGRVRQDRRLREKTNPVPPQVPRRYPLSCGLGVPLDTKVGGRDRSTTGEPIHELFS